MHISSIYILHGIKKPKIHICLITNKMFYISYSQTHATRCLHGQNYEELVYFYPHFNKTNTQYVRSIDLTHMHITNTWLMWKTLGVCLFQVTNFNGFVGYMIQRNWIIAIIVKIFPVTNSLVVSIFLWRIKTGSSTIWRGKFHFHSTLISQYIYVYIYIHIDTSQYIPH